MTAVRVMHNQIYDGQLGNLMMNVYYFDMDSVDETSLGFLTLDIENDLVGPIQLLQTNAVKTTTIVAETLDGVIQYVRDVDTTGSQAGADTYPKFVAAGFKLNRSTTVTRAGRKRLVGMRETDFTIQGNPTDATVQTKIDNIKIAMGTTWEPEPSNFAVPVIWKRDSGIVTPVLNPISGVTYTGITSQNTRKS